MHLEIRINPIEPDQERANVVRLDAGPLTLSEGQVDGLIDQARVDLNRHNMDSGFSPALVEYRYSPTQQWAELITINAEEHVGADYATEMGLIHENGWVRREVKYS
tara:strand:- start:982 stop:1299 length:318 start_codon:yes stop_codon:yes gene_type:complete